jgi:hypothetical protein
MAEKVVSAKYCEKCGGLIELVRSGEEEKFSNPKSLVWCSCRDRGVLVD